jgi:hypothetical protein
LSKLQSFGEYKISRSDGIDPQSKKYTKANTALLSQHEGLEKSADADVSSHHLDQRETGGGYTVARCRLETFETLTVS